MLSVVYNDFLIFDNVITNFHEQSLKAVFQKDPLFRLIRDHNFCRCAEWLS